MSVTISFTNPAYIANLSKTEPNEAAAHCKMAMSSLHGGFNRRKYELLGAIVRIAYDLTAIRKAWGTSCKNPFWEQFKRKPRNSSRGQMKALRLVMRFVFDAKTKNEINVTNRYAKMLEEEYNNSVAPTKIADIIEEHGGIEGLRKARVGDRRKERLKREREKHEQWERDLKKDFGDLDNNDDNNNRKEIVDNRYSLSKKQYKKSIVALNKFYKSSTKYLKSSIRQPSI
ncbi:hypothetical protein [Methylobacterium sp. J-070]|uniref:hypothetical protein n=1 Tax=Methylobacterium sp. J-070 TaxID=2836650 RepID=UPI001FBB469A|nr:hypothetical protein [Methylobacterium sp. J-070]MCJ2049079.1 hypothetical protein [Methylobacterium sp. J-070]